RGGICRLLSALRVGTKSCASLASRTRSSPNCLTRSQTCPGGETRVDKGLLSLVIAGVAFCGSHILLSSTRLRGSLRDQLGERGFLAGYSLTSLVIFS